MTSATPAQRAREIVPVALAGAGAGRRRNVRGRSTTGFADAILRVGGSAREVASSIPPDCGTLEREHFAWGPGEGNA